MVLFFCRSARLETFFAESLGHHGFRHPVILETGTKSLFGKKVTGKWFYFLSQRAFGNVFKPNHLGINGAAIP